MRILLVIYDNGSTINFFPIGLAYIAKVLQKNGYDIEIYSQDKNHYTDEHLTEYLNNNEFDIIGVSIIAGYYQYQKIKNISDAINKSKKRPFYILGGHGPTPEPDFFINKTQADAIIMGEGEETIVDLLNNLKNHKSLKTVKGIAYRDGNKTIVNERRPLIKNIDEIDLPAYNLFPMDYYRLRKIPFSENNDFIMDVISGRGCTFQCSFCYRMDTGFRPRSAESIIEEINVLKMNYGITYVSFQDELLMSSVERTENICKAFIKAKLNIKWNCNGRLNYAKPELIKLMKDAGCVLINYGVESMDDIVLKNMNKSLTTKIIVEGVENTLKSGISPTLNVIFGNIGDNKKTLKKDVDFLIKYDDCSGLRTIRPVTPYPGSPLYYHAIKNGLLKDCEDFYENKHKNSDLLSINFTTLSDDEFHTLLYKANWKLIKNFYKKQNLKIKKQIKKLYLERDSSFRGFRHS
jgi:anaerobic magnesium-protoporphyrin IX monomethyl ester cyclase